LALRRTAAVTLLALAVTLAAPAPATGAPPGSDHPRTLHVAGSARAPGDGSVARPFLRISQAVGAAEAGDTVLVGPRGIARSRLVQLLHDHVTVESLELSHANILVWVQGTRGVRLLGNRIHDAGGECVRLKDYAQQNEVAGNAIARCGRVGLHVHGRSRSVVADANRFTANRADGLRVATGATAVTASRNLIDFNHRAGVFVAEGTARIGPANRLLDNEMGVWLSSDAAGTAVLDNSIEANVLDGVHLAGVRVGLVRGNTIRANRKAAFSVATRGTARLFLAGNRLAGNPEKERVRVEGHPQPTG
jgi:hypothetical protein